MSRSKKPYAFEEGKLDYIEKLFTSLIQAKGFGTNEPLLTIDLMEHLITVLRHKHQNTNSKQSFETFLASNVSVINDQISIIAPKGPLKKNSGTPPIQFQPALLRYLLIFHNHAYPVHEIVENFVISVWKHLDIVDFKRTKTGVTRCHTNTRFAARTLRNYGFLKFSDKERHKTWRLSLPGFLVASKLIESETWHPNYNVDCGLVLHKDLVEAKRVLDSYGSFVGQLNKLCKPQTKIFETYDEILESAYELLHKYWDTITNYEMNNGERRVNCMALMRELEKHKYMDKFYEEFSMAMLTSELLQTISNKDRKT